jgi:hypothetical protein
MPFPEGIDLWIVPLDRAGGATVASALRRLPARAAATGAPRGSTDALSELRV